MGHTCVPLQEDDPESWRRLLEWGDAPLDMVLWTRTWHLPQMPQREALAAMRERDVPTVGYHLDKYWGLPREQQIYDEPWWRCLPGSTRVRAGSVRGVTRRWYEGVVVRVTTSEHDLTATPNHPILTGRGWVAAGELREGDDLVSAPLGERTAIGPPHIDDLPPTLQEIFEAADRPEGRLTTRRERIRGVPVDFHGDGAHGDVDVVWADGDLALGTESSCFEPADDLRLVLSEAGEVSGAHSMAEFVARWTAQPVGFTEAPESDSLLAQSPTYEPLRASRDAEIGRDRLERLPVGVAAGDIGAKGSSTPPLAFDRPGSPRPHGRPGFEQPLVDSSDRETQVVSEFSDSGPSLISLAKVQCVDRVQFAGHVYNLVTTDGAYIADEILVHNCEFMFTADGGNEDRFAEAGVNHIWAPPAMLADNCVAGSAHGVWLADVGFIGTVNGYHPEWTHRAELVTFLRQTYGDRFRHFGRGTDPLPEEYMGDAIASFKVIVGDSCNIDGRGRYWSNRCPETLGRGGFLIHHRVEGIEDWYTDGEHLRLYELGHWDELRGLIDYYLEHPDEAAVIARQGQELVRSRDTFRHRMTDVLEHVFAESRVVSRRLHLANPIDRKTAWEVFDEGVYLAAPHINEGDTVVDLGANVGLFSLWALERGAGRVLAVEPWEENREGLARNLAASGFLDRVDVVAAAVWACSGRAGFELGVGDAAGRDAHLAPDPAGKIELVSLDDLVAGIREVAVLKVDVEGAEYALIEGAGREAIRRCRFITMEFHRPDQAEACGWDAPNPLGRLVDKLAETHHIEVLGRPSVGGYIRALRYDEQEVA